MGKKKAIHFFFATLLIGFMLAVLFNSTKENEKVVTQDMWQLREKYLKAKELETSLLQEIRKNEEIIAKYEAGQENSRAEILKETIAELKKEAGLTELQAPGIIITIREAAEFNRIGPDPAYISPDLLQRLINELNRYGAVAISIADQRIVNTTAIRVVQGETKIDSYPIRTLPIEVKAAAENEEDAAILYNGMQISNLADQFYLDHLTLSISEVREISIPASRKSVPVKHMESVPMEGGG
jgi:Bacterial protein of unknown function (DUF881).